MGKPTFDPASPSAVRVQRWGGARLDLQGHEKGFVPETIGYKGEPGELKHLSTRRKGHQRDSVSSGERTRIRPAPVESLPERSGKAGMMGDSPVRDGRDAGRE